MRNNHYKHTHDVHRTKSTDLSQIELLPRGCKHCGREWLAMPTSKVIFCSDLCSDLHRTKGDTSIFKTRYSKIR